MRFFRTLTKIYPILTILVILGLYFNKLIFQNQIYVTGDYLRSDILSHNLPAKYLLYENLRHFTFPFWTNLISFGFPPVGDGHPGLFYPPNLISFTLLPFIKGFNFSIIVNFLIASLGMYYLAKSFKISTPASLFASIAFSLSSFFTLHIVHHSILNSSAWLPLYFLFLKKFYEERKPLYFFLSSLILALEILGGFPQIVLYSTLTALIFYSYLAIKEKRVLKFFLSYSVIVLLGLLLSAIQLLPSLELVKESTRDQGLGSLTLDSLPYHPRNLITFINPSIFGDPGKGTYPHFGGDWGMFWENTGYLGILALVFAFLTLILVKKNKAIAGFWMVTAISILLALGKFGPLFWIFYLPGFNFFRVTGRFLLPTIFALAILAGFGIDYLNSKLRNKLLQVGLLASAILITVIDLFGFSYKYNPTVEASEILSPPPILKSIKLNPGERVFSIGASLIYDEINKEGWRDNLEANINHKNALDPNLNILWQIPSIEGYTGLFIGKHDAFKNRLYQGLIPQENRSIKISTDTQKLLQFSSNRYLISAFDLKGEDLEKVGEFGEEKKYKLYELKKILPRGVLLGHSGSVGEGKVNLIKDTVTNLEFQVTSPKEQEFLLQNTFYPGWQAFINGEEKPIKLSNRIFQSVTAPAGESEIKFVYHPNSFYIGSFISTISSLTIIFILISPRLLKPRSIS